MYSILIWQFAAAAWATVAGLETGRWVFPGVAICGSVIGALSVILG